MQCEIHRIYETPFVRSLERPPTDLVGGINYMSLEHVVPHGLQGQRTKSGSPSSSSARSTCTYRAPRHRRRLPRLHPSCRHPYKAVGRSEMRIRIMLHNTLNRPRVIKAKLELAQSIRILLVCCRASKSSWCVVDFGVRLPFNDINSSVCSEQSLLAVHRWVLESMLKHWLEGGPVGEAVATGVAHKKNHVILPSVLALRPAIY